MTLAVASVLLALLNLTSATLIAERRRAGWLVALAAQLPWSWYDLRTGQLGFLLLTLLYVPVYVRGWRTARRPSTGSASRTRGHTLGGRHQTRLTTGSAPVLDTEAALKPPSDALQRAPRRDPPVGHQSPASTSKRDRWPRHPYCRITRSTGTHLLHVGWHIPS